MQEPGVEKIPRQVNVADLKTHVLRRSEAHKVKVFIRRALNVARR